MRLISGISVRSFRSLRSVDIEDLDDFVSIAGLNNSGKSNLLRALNGFFRGETEPGDPIDVVRDYYRPDIGKKKARKIRVTVRFDLPDSFSFRKDLKHVEDALGRRFDVAKEWSRSHDAVAYFLNGVPQDLEGQRRIDQFLGLINFRYVPNRVLPIDVIRGEHQALRDALVRRVAKKAQGSENAFEALRETSTSLISSMVERVQSLQPDAGTVRLATPTSWRDMVFAFGYMLQQGDTELEDVLQGSGLQSLLMLETLHLIDQDYFQKFGWRQAAVWALEEPESSLHTSLEAQVAQLLNRIANAPTSRLQILCTTHSDLILQYSDGSLFARRDNAETSLSDVLEPRAALQLATNAGVSRWVHPLLYFPLDPIVLVEGRSDESFLKEVIRLRFPGSRARVVTLASLRDDPERGGVETLQRYVKEHADVIKARRSDAPVVVVLDWESSGKVSSFKKLFADGDPFDAMAWPQDSANPKLGKSFRGIERFYSDRLVRLAESQGFPIARTGDGVATIDKDEYGALKRWLSERIEREGLQAEDLEHAEGFVKEILVTCGDGVASLGGLDPDPAP